jgi:hypothetical protein
MTLRLEVQYMKQINQTVGELSLPSQDRLYTTSSTVIAHLRVVGVEDSTLVFGE